MPNTHAWAVPPKPDQTIKRRSLVKPKSGARWAKGGLVDDEVYAKDLLSMMHEQTGKDLEKFRHPHQEDFKNAEKRMGRKMMSNEFIRIITKLNPNLTCEDSVSARGCAAFYYHKRNPRTGKPEKVYTAACFKKGCLPEFTIFKTDAADLLHSDGITYGWREVLRRLIVQKLISYRQMKETFGEVDHVDLRGQNWNVSVRPFRY